MGLCFRLCNKLKSVIRTGWKDWHVNKDRLEPKVIPSMNVPEVSISNETDYKAKYEESLETVRKLENENMRLINELVEAKAKLATIKDVIE